MAISKKNKSRVIFDGKEYLWWVFEEIDQTTFDGIQIKIICSDQTHFLKYGLQQNQENRIVAIALSEYSKLVHLSSPKFENEEGIITKSGIVNLLRWCRNENHEILYALDRSNNDLTEEEKQLVLREIQKFLQ
jgi:hypothetical protein